MVGRGGPSRTGWNLAKGDPRQLSALADGRHPDLGLRFAHLEALRCQGNVRAQLLVLGIIGPNPASLPIELT
jgi:hypothetical protein